MSERIDFNVEKDGFSAHFYPGTKKPGKAIIYTGGAGCNEKMCVRAGQFLVREGYSVFICGRDFRRSFTAFRWIMLNEPQNG